MPRTRLERERGEKIWYTIQMPAELRDAISDKARRERVNASAFFRQCGEIFVGTPTVKEALKKIEKLAASLKITGTGSRNKKYEEGRMPKTKSKVTMPDRANLT